jgi:hypothetical protein
VVRPPGTKGHLVSVGNTNHDKRWGISIYAPSPSRSALSHFRLSPPLASLHPSSSLPPLLFAPVLDAPLLDERLLSDAPLRSDATPLPDTRTSPSPAASELDRADVRPSPRCISPRGAPPRHASPPQLTAPAGPGPAPPRASAPSQPLSSIVVPAGPY